MTKTTTIIGGRYKGHKIKLVPSLDTKATSSLVKEALFNMIGTAIKDKVLLDLFAGNGSYGFEALSHNALKVFFVDASLKAFRTLKYNQFKLKLDDEKSVIFYAHYLVALKKMQKLNLVFDFVIIDPPYFKALYEPAFVYLGKLTHDKSIIICESHRRIYLPLRMKEFELIKVKIYGNKKLNFYHKVTV
ncbi:16S rRNA (guanine(966)-N(2))-methyltransferase RsmD ['Fragaria x ananassa' phyllody phytoplasma]|uniref:16S rRNA (Guanine(966)-N(2))-methyltransferase RsmD n=1 Tax='Fragaria x ananassa' phyllody phytoplasma TaxID=2358428 RepID=A0ABS5K318_9MOLU|nr:16S rRNA (guanine(966)-N(2))-methyltransferase RsmD ['Fragaria x ananassa' phyllody phytoplasma]MBS2126292.1 16S rRNA (guanine(966)-N(2))-methyltransferase RsmD ['Fragaria x ananassa' phyllody phytoplasma]